VEGWVREGVALLCHLEIYLSTHYQSLVVTSSGLLNSQSESKVSLSV